MGKTRRKCLCKKLLVGRGTGGGERKIARQPENKPDVNGDHIKSITENLMEKKQGSRENHQELRGIT